MSVIYSSFLVTYLNAVEVPPPIYPSFLYLHDDEASQSKSVGRVTTGTQRPRPINGAARATMSHLTAQAQRVNN